MMRNTKEVWSLTSAPAHQQGLLPRQPRFDAQWPAKQQEKSILIRVPPIATLDVKLKAPNGTNIAVKGKQGFDNVTSGSVSIPRFSAITHITDDPRRSRPSTQSSNTVRKIKTSHLLLRPNPLPANHRSPLSRHPRASCNSHISTSLSWNCRRPCACGSTSPLSPCRILKSSR
jgi:hypothetical protein